MYEIVNIFFDEHKSGDMSGSCLKWVLFPNRHVCPYLLGLLAMIKCSICSYQCDIWYVSNWRLACHMYFSLGRYPLELAQGTSCVALASHIARSSTPFGVTEMPSWLGVNLKSNSVSSPSAEMLHCRIYDKWHCGDMPRIICNGGPDTLTSSNCILAEGAMTLPVTLSGGVLFASWKLLQFLSSLIVKVILAIFTGASAQLVSIRSIPYNRNNI